MEAAIWMPDILDQKYENELPPKREILILTLTRTDVGFESSLLSRRVSRFVETGTEERRRQPKEDIGVVRVLLIAHREYFNNQTNSQIIIHFMFIIISLI